MVSICENSEPMSCFIPPVLVKDGEIVVWLYPSYLYFLHLFYENSFPKSCLNLSVLVKDGDNTLNSAFEVTGDSNRNWQRANVNIGSYSQLVFEIVVIFPRNAAGSAVAIDDISFAKCVPGKLLRRMLNIAVDKSLRNTSHLLQALGFVTTDLTIFLCFLTV